VGRAGRFGAQFAGQVLHALRQGHGRYGACVDYVLQTALALNEAGIPDRRLQAIVRALQSPEFPLS
jgi:cation transport protein ChaC